MQMVVQKKKFARCIPVPDQTCTYTFWRAERERGESEVVVSAAYAVTGRGWRQFFGNAPDLHTPLCGFGGARKGTANRRSTQRPISGCHLSLAGESSAQGNDEGGRADGSKRQQPGGGKKLPSSCCVLPYCRNLLLKNVKSRTDPASATGNNDVTYPIQSGGRCGAGWAAPGRQSWYIPSDPRVYQKGHMLHLGKKRSKGDFILLSGANLG